MQRETWLIYNCCEWVECMMLWIQRNKLEFGIILSSYNNENCSRYFIISIHSIAPLYSVASDGYERASERAIAVRLQFLYAFIFGSHSLMISYLLPSIRLIFWIRFARVGVFISSENKYKQFFLYFSCSSSFFHLYFVIHQNCLHS